MSGQTATTSAARRVLANNAIMLEILNHLGNTDLVSLSPALLPSVAAILYRRINGDIYDKITSSFERWAGIYRDSVRAIETVEPVCLYRKDRPCLTYEWVEEARRQCPNLVTFIVMDKELVNSSRMTVHLYPEGGGQVSIGVWSDLTEWSTERPLEVKQSVARWPGYTVTCSLGIGIGHPRRRAKHPVHEQPGGAGQGEYNQAQYNQDQDAQTLYKQEQHEYAQHEQALYDQEQYEYEQYEHEHNDGLANPPGSEASPGHQATHDEPLQIDDDHSHGLAAMEPSDYMTDINPVHWDDQEHESEFEENDEEEQWEEDQWWAGDTEAITRPIAQETLDKLVQVIRVDKRIDRVDFGLDIVTLELLGDICRARIDSHGIPMDTVIAKNLEPFSTSDLADFGARATGLRHLQLWLDLSPSSVQRFAGYPITLSSLRSIVQVVNTSFPYLSSLSLNLKGCRTADESPIEEQDMPVSDHPFEGKLERIDVVVEEKYFQNVNVPCYSPCVPDLIPWFAIAKNLACLGSKGCVYRVSCGITDVDVSEYSRAIGEVIKWYRGLPAPCVEYMRRATPSGLRIAGWKELTALDFLISGRPILCPYKDLMLAGRRGEAGSTAPVLDSLWASLEGSSRDRRRGFEEFARAVEGFQAAAGSERRAAMSDNIDPDMFL